MLFYFNISILFTNQFIDDLIRPILAGVFRPKPSQSYLPVENSLSILMKFFFSEKHAWRMQLRLVWLCYSHQNLMWSVWSMSISGWLFNSHLDRTVSLTTLSSKVLTPSYQNSCLENILICMCIVEIAENDRHLYSYSSLCVTAVCTYSFLNLYIFGAEVYSFST